MQLKVVAKRIHSKNSVTFLSFPFAFDLRETALFLRDTSPAYEIPLNSSNLLPKQVDCFFYDMRSILFYPIEINDIAHVLCLSNSIR